MFSALRHRDFRMLWLSQSASTIGDALVIVAIGLYVTRLTGRPSDVGIVLAAYSVPLVVFVLIGGVIADRLPRQKLMIATDVTRAVLHGTLAVLIATGRLQIWHFVVIGLLFGTAQAFFQPAYTGLVPQTLPEDEIQGAQALGGASRELAQFASPALATALVLGVGGAYAFGLDALTFVVSAAVLSRLRPRSRGAVAERSSVLAELREGIAEVRRHVWVWSIIAAFSAALLTALAPFFVLGATVSRQVYGTEVVFGLTNAAWGVGTVTGAVIASRWTPRRPMYAGVLCCIAWPGAIALYGAGPPVAVLYPVMALAGVGIGVFDVFWQTALAQRIPPHLLSRVSAWDWMGSLALLPLGYLLAGPIAHAVGDATVLVGGGLIGLVALAAALLPRTTRRLQRLDSADPVNAVAAPKSHTVAEL